MKQPPQLLAPEDVRFEIRFALGQAKAGIYADIRRDNFEKRRAALDLLADQIAERFADMTITRSCRSYGDFGKVGHPPPDTRAVSQKT